MTPLTSLTLASSATSSFNVSWIYPNGRSGVDEVTVCTAGSCGDGEASRVAHLNVSPALFSTNVSLQNGLSVVNADSFKMIALSFSGPNGLQMQSNFMSCSGNSCF
ncbi:MAG: hypothetical protein V4525_07810 [Pseudomonadota bacterium]